MAEKRSMPGTAAAAGPMAAGMSAMRSVRMDEAVSHFRRVLEHDPGNADALANLGVALSALGNHGEAVHRLQAASQRQPWNALLLRTLGKELLDWGDANGAADCFEALLRLAPKDGFALAHLGQARRGQGRETEARDIWEKALDLDPKNADALCFLGGSEIEAGRTAEAAALQRRALEAQPFHAAAHFNLAQIGRNGDAEARLQQIETALRGNTLVFDETVPLHFAAAKILDDRGDMDLAFVHLSAGNRLVWSRFGLESRLYVQQTEDLIRVFDDRYFRARATELAESRMGEGLIFILGMPRSGTTLVEQILGSHPDVAAGGERVDIRALGESLPARFGTQEPFPFAARGLNAASSGTVAEEHLARVRAMRGGKTHFTDKTPANFLRLGLIATLFPRAKVIHCRREAEDTCLSCYAQLFGRNSLLYTYDLATLGLYYRLYERLMEHWRRVLPLPVLDVVYEDVVADPAQKAQDIIRFCGIPWDDACLRFHEKKGAVRTASAWQVRQAVYKTSVGRWRRYERHLGPLLKALGRAVG